MEGVQGEVSEWAQDICTDCQESKAELSTMRKDIHTIKGVFHWDTGPNVATVDPKRLILDNGDFEKNFIVESFEVFPTGMESVSHNPFPANGTVAVLATRPGGAVAAGTVDSKIRGAMVNDDRQIGWSLFDAQQMISHLDPDHIIVEDLWVNCWVVDGASGALYQPNQPVGYIIKLRQVKNPIFEAIMALVKARAQDDEPGDQ